MSGLEITADWWRPEPVAAATPAAAQGREGSRAAFAALQAFTAILIVSPQAWFPVLGSLRIALVAAAVAIVAELLDQAMHRREGRTPRELVLVFAIVGWAVVTVPLSYWPGGSVAALTDHFLKAVAFFWLIGTVITTERRLRRFLWLLVLVSMPMSLTALQNYASGTFLQTPDGAAPRIAGYVTGGSGIAANPNDLALMINLLLPFAAAQLVIGRGLIARVAGGLALLLGAAGVIVTFSRAGFLTLVAMGLVALIAMARRRPLALIATLVMLAAGSAMLPPGYFARLSTITNIASDTTGSAQGRWNDALVAMEVAARNPLTGVGLDQNVLALNQERGATWREVHNVYLQYAVDLGVPGLVLFLALFACLFRTAGRVRRRARAVGLSGLGVVSGSVQTALAGFAVAAFFHPVAYQFYFFLIAGLALAVQQVLHASVGPKAEAA